MGRSRLSFQYFEVESGQPVADSVTNGPEVLVWGRPTRGRQSVARDKEHQMELPVVLAQEVGGDFDFGTILRYLLIGAVIGIIARLLVPDTGGMGWIVR